MKINIKNLKYYKQGRKDAIEEFDNKLEKAFNKIELNANIQNDLLRLRTMKDRIKKELQ